MSATTRTINGVPLYSEIHGEGAAVVLVHGSWGDHHNWAPVVPGLAREFRVCTYDRRGHSRSVRPATPGTPGTPGTVDEDVADLAALITEFRLAPAHVVGHSFGATIALKLAVARPALLATLIVHDPPLTALLGADPALAGVEERIAAVASMVQAGDVEAGAREFVEKVALGPGMWEQLPPEIRRTFVANARTWLDEMSEPAAFTLDTNRLSTFGRPALLTQGSESPPFFGAIVNRISQVLPKAKRHTFAGAGHVPHLTHPDEFVRVIGNFIRGDVRASPENEAIPRLT